MEIVNKQLYGQTLTLVLSSAIPANTEVVINIDDALNYGKNGDDHDYSETLTISDTSQVISVTVPYNIGPCIVVTVKGVGDTIQTLFVNWYMIYCAQKRHLAKYELNGACNCDEKIWRSTTLAIMLRCRLLEYSYEQGLWDDAIKYYEDLTRVLNFDGISFESIPFTQATA